MMLPGPTSVAIPNLSGATRFQAVPGLGRSLSRSRWPLSIPIVATWDSEHVTAGSRVVTAIRCCCCLPLSLLIGSVQHSSIGSRDVAVVVFVVAGSDGSGSLSREAACLAVLNLRSVLPSRHRQTPRCCCCLIPGLLPTENFSSHRTKRFLPRDLLQV